jgi:hypothetical protein
MWRRRHGRHPHPVGKPGLDHDPCRQIVAMIRGLPNSSTHKKVEEDLSRLRSQVEDTLAEA